jgi:CubicO group peptidase (beta-lactamase class C family)
MKNARMIVFCCLCFFFVAALAFGEAAAESPYEGAIVKARTEIWKEINSGRSGSATAAIMVDGKTVYAEGFGMADREKGIPVTRTTLFNIGSISKVHVATAVMLLVDDGKVSLDRPVTEYLPEFKMADGRYRKITVRMLLNHTSGLPGTEGSNSFGFRYEDRVKRETLETLSRAHLKHDPGARAVYCNDGFTLAELIVERVSGMGYLTFLEKRMFRPLGFKNTGIGVGEIKGKQAARYYDPKAGKRHPLETLSVLGAGGLSSTAEELCRFMDAFSPAGRLLKKASVAEMRKAQPAPGAVRLRNPAMSVGLGWDMTGLPRYDAAGVQVLGKSGGTGNYSSMVYTVPDRRISVAVIEAGEAGSAMKIALNILDAVLVAKKLVPRAEKSVRVPPVPETLPPDHASFAGYYASDSKLGRVVFDAEKKSATLFLFKEREQAPAGTLVYSDGYYHDAEGGRSYFARSGGETYYVSAPEALGIDVIALQKVKPVEKPQSLRIDLDGKVWLRRNVSPWEGIMAVESHFAKSILYKDLPGYVFFNGMKRIESPGFAGMPFDAVRDQSELTLFEKDGAVWAWLSDLLYSPAETAAPLKAGETAVKIGADGYNRWLAAAEDVIVSVRKPERGRVIVFAPEDAAVYDSALDRGDVYVRGGSYLEFAGLAGDVFVIRSRPARTGGAK